jgi:ribonuclease R
VKVQVTRVDLDARKIDLCLVQPGGIRAPSNQKNAKSGTPAKVKAIVSVSGSDGVMPPKRKSRGSLEEEKHGRAAKPAINASKREKKVLGRSKGNVKVSSRASSKKR